MSPGVKILFLLLQRSKVEGWISDVFPICLCSAQAAEKIKRGTYEKELESGSQDPQTDVGKSNVSVAMSVTLSPRCKDFISVAAEIQSGRWDI